MPRNYIWIACCLLLSTASHSQDRQGKPDLPGMILSVARDTRDLDRLYPVKYVPGYLDRMQTYYDTQEKALRSLPFKSITRSDQVDYLLLQREIRHAQHELREQQELFTSIKSLLPFEEQVMVLVNERQRGNNLDAVTAAEQFNSIGKSAKELLETADLSHLNIPATQYLSKVLYALQAGLDYVYNFYNGYDPQFSWWCKAPYAAAKESLNNYRQRVQKQEATLRESLVTDASGIKGTPVGKAALEELLTYEMIPYSPEELVTIANKEFAWCDAQMLKASREMGYGNDWKKALEAVKQHYVPPGQQPALIHRLADEAIRYVDSADLVTVPAMAKELWRMNMLTAEQQRFAPFFLGGESILIAYPTDEMDHDTKMMSLRSNNYAFSHATVFHELIPGHNLQGFMNARYKSYRGMFRTPFSVEGWALYWEMLLWDKGFHATPEEKIGALFWRMHRCARIIFSLNYHLGKWTPSQCIDFLVDRVGHEKHSATSEVRRSFEGNYGPLYQIAYMMGGLQLRSLYREVVEGGKMTAKQFHDAYLHENAIPNELFRATVIDVPLNPDYKTNWRFADLD